MPRLRLPLSLALLGVVVLAAPAPLSAQGPSQRMADGINWWRATAGKPRLYNSRRLRRSARRRARVMMRRDFFAHPSRLRVPRFKRVGEVLELHSGRRARVGRTLRRWERSPSHRRVLMSTRLHGVGVGRATGRWRGRRATIWVVRLGTK